jgi:nucleotide-binding universal stress UspA family protein
MFSTLYVPVDNSEHSTAAGEVALALAHVFGGRIVGSHVYAARMHDYRFKQMEYTLPEEYQDEQELEHQRKIHDTLITRGLRLISDSYLDVLQDRCAAECVPFEPRTMDGRNWEKLVEDINASHYDLVIMGAQGFGAQKEAQLGSVCERVVRRTRTDTLVIKDPHAWPDRPEGSIAVCIDGSPQCFGGLRLAIELGRALGRPVEAVAVYDPYLHYAMFNGIVGVLSQEASKVFRFKEQEQLHEEIIDTGLAKIYESHLQVARRVAEQEGVDLKVTLLDGKAWEKVLHWTRKERPWLLVMGRIGVHSDETMDIGSNSENLLRAAPCNVLLASSAHVPPVDIRAEEVVVWTPEANQMMERVPAFVRGVARTAIHRWALERGTSVISCDIVDQAVADILPPSAAQAMGIVAKRIAVDHELATLPAPDATNEHAGKTYVCGECGYAARDVLPVACPVCRSGPERFAIIDRRAIEAAAARQGLVSAEETFDGHKVVWSEDARRLLFAMSDAYARRRAKARIEKQARVRRLPAVTLEFASLVIQEMLGDLSRLHANHLTDEAASAPNDAATVDATVALPATPPTNHGASETPTVHTPVGEMPWTAEAIQRLDRVPEGYMRRMTRELVLEHAASSGASSISLAVCEAGIEVAKQQMLQMVAERSAHKAARGEPGLHGHAAQRQRGRCPVADEIHAAASAPACPAPGTGHATSSASVPSPAERQDGHAGVQPALNEIEPAFIARLARYYAPGIAARAIPPALDFIWSPEAEHLLKGVPAYCRELARWRVEWTAYRMRLGRLITPELCRRDHPDWSELTGHLRLERLRRLAWEPLATTRLEAVPLFVRDQVALAVEINADHLGYQAVTVNAFDTVTARWQEEVPASGLAGD